MGTKHITISQDIHKDIQEHNIQKLTQDNLTLKFEITVRLIK